MDIASKLGVTQQTEKNTVTENLKAVEKVETEYAKFRKSINVSMKELSEEIGIPEPVYQMHESGKREYKTPEKKESFYYKVHHAGHKIIQRLKNKSQDLELNTYKPTKEFDNIEDEIDDELSLKLIYPPITEEIFDKAMQYIAKGWTVVKTAVELEVDEVELGRMMKKRGIPCDMGDSYATLLDTRKYPTKYMD